MSFDSIMAEQPRRSRTVSMETGGLPLVSTFALLTIVAGKIDLLNYYLVCFGTRYIMSLIVFLLK
jgi:hypothetical protein